MAKKQQSNQAPQKKTIFCFTASCFKFSDHIKSKQKTETTTGDKNRRRWLCWSRRLKLKNPAAAKTVVPVDGSPAAASFAKSKKFQIGFKGRSREAEPPCHQDHTTADEAPDGGGRGCRIEETPTEAVTDQNLAVETHFDPTEPATCPPTGRKLATVRYAAASSSSQPGSPDQIRTRVPGVRSAVMSPPSSSPIIKNPFSKTSAGKKLEPVVAMSVIMVTLLIMVMWGRLCAILCTSAWLYFIPKFRSRELGSGGLGSGSRLDIESEEYKKKVVLDGLLHRTRRS